MSDIIKIVIDTIYDCIETCLKTFTIPSGKRMIEVTCVSGLFSIFAVISAFVGFPVFINLYEALVTLVISVCLAVFYYIKLLGIEEVKHKLKEKKGRIKHGRK